MFLGLGSKLIVFVKLVNVPLNTDIIFFTGEGMNGSERDKRLRPERPKKENPDFDYEFSLDPENLVAWVKREQMSCPLSQQNDVNLEKLQENQKQVPQVHV